MTKQSLLINTYNFSFFKKTTVGAECEDIVRNYTRSASVGVVFVFFCLETYESFFVAWKHRVKNRGAEGRIFGNSGEGLITVYTGHITWWVCVSQTPINWPWPTFVSSLCQSESATDDQVRTKVNKKMVFVLLIYLRLRSKCRSQTYGAPELSPVFCISWCKHSQTAFSNYSRVRVA